MERDDIAQLPGGFFRRKFFLQYASVLGIQDEIEQALRRSHLFDEQPQVPGEETPRMGSDMPAIKPDRDWSALWNSARTFGGTVAVVLVCAAVYVWWQAETRSNFPQVTAAPPLDPAPSEHAPTSTEPAPVSEPEPASRFPVRVNLVAGEETWVQASADGKRVYTDALQANQTKLIEAADTVRILLGNAGGVEIVHNGQAIGAVGPRGQVRVVEFTANGYQIVPRKPPTPEPL